MKRAGIVILTILLATVLALPVAAGTGSYAKYKFSGTGADAYWFSDNGNGTFTDTFVSVVQVSSKQYQVAVGRYTYIPPEEDDPFYEPVPVEDYFQVFNIPASSFVLAKDFGSASLNTITPDGKNISVTWMPEYIEQGKFRSTIRSGDATLSYRSSGTSAFGPASGQVLDTDMGAGYGVIFESRTVEIIKGTLPW